MFPQRGYNLNDNTGMIRCQRTIGVVVLWIEIVDPGSCITPPLLKKARRTCKRQTISADGPWLPVTAGCQRPVAENNSRGCRNCRGHRVNLARQD